MPASPITFETLAYLRSAAGARLLDAAAEALASSSGPLQALTRLRRSTTPERAGAAIETVTLRAKAAGKFALAGRMFFTADGLEQASGELLAAHSARRFASFDTVADLGCGIGGDTLELARLTSVIACDRDPLRLAIARANLEVNGFSERTSFVPADFIANPPVADAAFCDPGRRDARGRIFDVRRYQPPLASVLALARSLRLLGVKVAPGIDHAELPAGCESEFVQEGSTLKEALIWLGSAVTAQRSAVLLPSGDTLTALPGEEEPESRIGIPEAYLFEPAPAVIRAHLVGRLAALLGAARLDAEIAYLTASTLTPTPFATAYRVVDWLPFNLKRLRQRLRELDAGALVVKKRGSPLEPEAVRAALQTGGSVPFVVVLTHVEGRHAAIICAGPVR